MKFKVDRTLLQRALAHIHGVAEKRNTIPILANVLLSYEGDVLRLTATDMEIAVVEDVPAAGERLGSTTVPAAVLFEIVRKLPDGVEIEFDHPESDAPSHCVRAVTRRASTFFQLMTSRPWLLAISPTASAFLQERYVA